MTVRVGAAIGFSIIRRAGSIPGADHRRRTRRRWTIKHVGLIDEDRILSKWGIGNLGRQPLLEVPSLRIPDDPGGRSGVNPGARSGGRGRRRSKATGAVWRRSGATSGGSRGGLRRLDLESFLLAA
jgi:hypothetical protein